MGREEDRIRQIIEDMARGEDLGDKLGYDRVTKTVRPISPFHDPDWATEITPEDATLYGTDPGISGERDLGTLMK